KLIADFVGSLSPSLVEITVPEDSSTLTVKSEDSEAKIKGMDSSEFPLIPTREGTESPVTMSAALLKEMIAEVAFAAADDESRPVFTGVLVQVGEKSITFAAADAFRLAVRKAPLRDFEGKQEDILIPARTLSELARILPSEGDVEMVVTPNRSQVLFHTDQIDLVSRLIEGNFPNYNQIIPKETTTRAVISSKDFAGRIKLASLFARDSSNITRLKINDKDESLTIEATAEDLGNNVSTLSAKVDGPEQQIIFNVKYLSDVMAVIGTAEVAIEVSAATKPGMIKPVGLIEGDYTYVIMPMHTNR
ncbi:MAG: DNA polymerase III subunit beta, partial [Ktedonobacteraceae bacterium]